MPNWIEPCRLKNVYSVPFGLECTKVATDFCMIGEMGSIPLQSTSTRCRKLCVALLYRSVLLGSRWFPTPLSRVRLLALLLYSNLGLNTRPA